MESQDKELEKRVAEMINKEFNRRNRHEREEIINSDGYEDLIASVQEYLDTGGDATTIPTFGPAFEYMQSQIVKGIKRGYWKGHPNWIADRALIGTAIRNGGRYLANYD